MTSVVAVLLLGLAVGFLVGFEARDALELLRSSRKAPPVKHHHTPPTSRAVLGAVLVVAVLAQFAVGILLIDARRDLADSNRADAAYEACSNRWSQRFATTYRVRLKAANETAAAIERTFRAVAEDDEQAFRRAIAHYVKVRDEQREAVKDNPPPRPPRKVCGEPSGGEPAP